MTREQLDETERMVAEICSDSIKPAIEIDTRRYEIEDKALLAVIVSAGYALLESPGGNFRRSGSSKRRLSSDERMRLAQRLGQARFPWFDEQVVPGTGFGTLDEALWKPLLSIEGENAPRTALRKLSLLAYDAANALRATVAGVLLCTKSPEEWLPNARITATRYRGGDRTTGQFDSQDITGSLHQQIRKAVDFSVRNMSVAARKVAMRVETPQYSVTALFEAIVSAVAHRGYSIRGSKIRLPMFEDRFELQSPGGLPNSLTVEEMPVHQSTRDEVLASVLGRMPVRGIRGSEHRRFFMETRGDGVPMLHRSTFQLSGRRPEYEVIGDSEVLLRIFSAKQTWTRARVSVSVRCAGKPLAGIDVLAVFPDEESAAGSTEGNGRAMLDLHATHLPMTVFVAERGFSAALIEG